MGECSTGEGCGAASGRARVVAVRCSTFVKTPVTAAASWGTLSLPFPAPSGCGRRCGGTGSTAPGSSGTTAGQSPLQALGVTEPCPHLERDALGAETGGALLASKIINLGAACEGMRGCSIARALIRRLKVCVRPPGARGLGAGAPRSVPCGQALMPGSLLLRGSMHAWIWERREEHPDAPPVIHFCLPETRRSC